MKNTASAITAAAAALAASADADAASAAAQTPAPVSAATPPSPRQSHATADFLGSIGIVTTMPDRGQPIDKTIEMINYCGFRWIRGGIEGVKEEAGAPTTVETYIELCKATNAKVNWGLVSGGSDLEKLLRTARKLDEAGVLLAFEGNNEPNNWGVTYQGEKGGRSESWIPLAKLQRDFYAAVKADPQFKKYPVWGPSEMGAQTDNVGLQFLAIPEGADTVMPPGTKYADALNVHNYIYHGAAPRYEDNKTWNCSSPGPDCKIDGLWGNHGLTWGKKFKGYSEAELAAIPKVTTETGTTIGGDVTEEIHGRHLVNIFLSQFARGWSHTSIYLLRDRTDESGNQTFGYFNTDYTPRKAAVYLHNFTTILADKKTDIEMSVNHAAAAKSATASLAYAIENQTPTTHDLLLQHSSGKFQLVIWGEKAQGSDTVTVRFTSPRAVKIYDPTVGAEPVEILAAADSLKLEVSDHPFVLEIQ